MTTTLNWSIPQTQDLKLPRNFAEKKKNAGAWKECL